MKKKRAKALAKLCGYNTHHPRKYFRTALGEIVSDEKRRSYQATKTMYKRKEMK